MPPSDPDFKHLDPTKPLRLYNAACAYCGVPFNQQVTRTKDHVIARNFVPPGQFDGEWNLILNACERCNAKKSHLESEVSAISMQPDAWGLHPLNDSMLAREAPRRARSVKNTRTGRPISLTEAPLVIDMQVMPGVSLKTSFTAPAQLDENTAHYLAWHHVTAFFYFITFDRNTRLGRRWKGKFIPLSIVRESDWGNSLMRSFQDLVERWDHRFHGVAASGYFGVSIRKSPDERHLWSWALEWNRTFRLVGFIGDESAARDAARLLTWPKKHVHHDGPQSSWAFRTEQRLPDGDDTLFSAPAPKATSQITPPHQQGSPQ